jgi:hypothetical protein
MAFLLMGISLFPAVRGNTLKIELPKKDFMAQLFE